MAKIRIYKNTLIKAVEDALRQKKLRRGMWLDYTAAEAPATGACRVCAVGAAFLALAKPTTPASDVFNAIPSAISEEASGSALSVAVQPFAVFKDHIAYGIKMQQWLRVMSHVFEGTEGTPRKRANAVIKLIRMQFPTYLDLEIDGLDYNKAKVAKVKPKAARPTVRE